MRVIICWYLFCSLILEASHDTLTFQLNDLAKKLTGRDIVCHREGQIISLPEATNGTFQSPCFRCICRNKTLVCSRKLCPPIPSNCQLIVPSRQDECCQECSHCLDERNRRRENGGLWPSQRNKCSRYVCESGIKTHSRMSCLNSCPTEIGIQSQAYCCRLCPLASSNEFSVDPCIRCETVAGFWQQCYKIACPVLNCPKDEQKHSRRKCCPHCVKRRELIQSAPQSSTSCQFRHLVYSRGQRFRPDPCSQCECTAVGLECKRYVCPVDCVGGYFRPQVCCPYCGHLRNQTISQFNLHSQCVIQLNSTQMVWKENDQWSPDACTTCSCKQGQVICQSRICSKPKCDPERQKQVTPVGQCCSSCLDLKKHQIDGTGLCKLMNGHLNSFDGQKLEIKRPCSFILTQQCLFDGELPSFVLKIYNNPKGDLQKLGIELTENGVRLGTLNLVKGKELKYRGRKVKLPQVTRIFHATYNKSRLMLDIHSIGLKIVWSEAKALRIHADRRHFGNLCGLCGNFNGIEKDDMLPRFGMNLTLNPRTFINSWQGEEDDCTGKDHKMDKFQDEAEEIISANGTTKMEKTSCTRLLSREHKEERRRFAQNCVKLKRSPYLSSCIHQIPVRKFINKCIVDVCECEKQNIQESTKMKEPCYCPSINEYAMECGKQGLLTLGQATQSINSSFLHIHAKCPKIQLERA